MAKDTVGYQLGKVTGDTVMLVGRLTAMAGGIVGEVGGTALYATGFGALAGAPIHVASWGLLVGGGTVVVQSAKTSLVMLVICLLIYGSAMPARKTEGTLMFLRLMGQIKQLLYGIK